MASNRPLDLDLREIRLITIQPSKSEDVVSDIIELALNHVPLSHLSFSAEYARWLSSHGNSVELEARQLWFKSMGQQPALDNMAHRYAWGDYVALSYTWGDEQETYKVRVNGTEAGIRRNLESALRAIRNQGFLRDGMKLWADALCINQQDDVEKGKQVALMGEIYSSAADVVIWLGSRDPNLRLVMDFLSSLSNCWDAASTVELEETLTRVLSTTPPKIWQLFNDFVRLPYWKRTWVLQEIAKGSTEMRVLYADKSVKWLDLYYAALYFNIPPNDKIGNKVRQIMSQFPEHVEEADHIMKPNYHYFLRVSNTEALRRERVEKDLMKLLTFTRHKLAARPRDKVYGVLGLMNRQIALQIQPEYGPDVTDDDVYEDFARKWVQYGDNLDILGQCSCQDSPSWVPHLHNSYRHLYAASEPPYDTSRGLRHKAHFSDGGKSLVCEGLLVDTVASVSTSFLHPDNESNSSLPPSALIAFGVNNNSNAYQDENGVREALWRTIVGNRNLSGSDAPDFYASLLSSHSLLNPDMLAWIKPNASFYIAGRQLVSYVEREPHEAMFRRAPVRWLRPLHSFAKRLKSTILGVLTRLGLNKVQPTRATDKPSGFDEAVTRVTRFAWSRRLMTTTKGLLGFGPEEARPGDIVAVLFGCSFPVLLRPSGSGYRLVKPCFVYGVMSGEAVVDYQRDVIKSREFTIV
ncbi:HET-domain-containing protein [Hypoxylon sp. FL1284]|nr:HET-domain-containing protein [Hypoxylon sp. FL1284]